MMTDFQLNKACFDFWLHAEGADNTADLEHAKRAFQTVLNEYVTVTQRDYILKYYVEQMTIVEIAEIYGVNCSTVSRTIRRGFDKAYGYLRFVSPVFLKTPMRRAPLKNGKNPDNRGRKRKIHAKPLEMFASKVNREKYPDAEQEYRFERKT